ncbi:MAG: hypothetical protein ACRC17_09260 [Culicoidibacterales bacterium]
MSKIQTSNVIKEMTMFLNTKHDEYVKKEVGGEMFIAYLPSTYLGFKEDEFGKILLCKNGFEYLCFQFDKTSVLCDLTKLVNTAEHIDLVRFVIYQKKVQELVDEFVELQAVLKESMED